MIGDDTDLLVLLCYHNNVQSPFSVYLKSEPKKDGKKFRIWNIKCTQEKIGIDMCRNILVLHAILACDTTSRILGLGKGMVLKKMASGNNFTTAVEVLNKLPSGVKKQDIIRAGQEATLICILGKAPSTV